MPREAAATEEGLKLLFIYTTAFSHLIVTLVGPSILHTRSNNIPILASSHTHKLWISSFSAALFTQPYLIFLVVLLNSDNGAQN